MPRQWGPVGVAMPPTWTAGRCMYDLLCSPSETQFFHRIRSLDGYHPGRDTPRAPPFISGQPCQHQNPWGLGRRPIQVPLEQKPGVSGTIRRNKLLFATVAQEVQRKIPHFLSRLLKENPRERVGLWTANLCRAPVTVACAHYDDQALPALPATCPQWLSYVVEGLVRCEAADRLSARDAIQVRAGHSRL